MNKQNIRFRTDCSFQSDISLRIEEASVNREAVFLTAQWGYFKMYIKVLNIKGSNLRHQNPIGEGAYACIYSGIYEQNKLIIKCNSKLSTKTRRRVIKEWFLLRVASAL